MSGRDGGRDLELELQALRHDLRLAQQDRPPVQLSNRASNYSAADYPLHTSSGDGSDRVFFRELGSPLTIDRDSAVARASSAVTTHCALADVGVAGSQGNPLYSHMYGPMSNSTLRESMPPPFLHGMINPTELRLHAESSAALAGSIPSAVSSTLGCPVTSGGQRQKRDRSKVILDRADQITRSIMELSGVNDARRIILGLDAHEDPPRPDIKGYLNPTAAHKSRVNAVHSERKTGPEDAIDTEVHANVTNNSSKKQSDFVTCFKAHEMQVKSQQKQQQKIASQELQKAQREELERAYLIDRSPLSQVFTRKEVEEALFNSGVARRYYAPEAADARFAEGGASVDAMPVAGSGRTSSSVDYKLSLSAAASSSHPALQHTQRPKSAQPKPFVPPGVSTPRPQSARITRPKEAATQTRLTAVAESVPVGALIKPAAPKAAVRCGVYRLPNSSSKSQTTGIVARTQSGHGGKDRRAMEQSFVPLARTSTHDVHSQIAAHNVEEVLTDMTARLARAERAYSQEKSRAEAALKEAKRLRAALLEIEQTIARRYKTYAEERSRLENRLSDVSVENTNLRQLVKALEGDVDMLKALVNERHTHMSRLQAIVSGNQQLASEALKQKPPFDELSRKSATVGSSGDASVILGSVTGVAKPASEVLLDQIHSLSGVEPIENILSLTRDSPYTSAEMYFGGSNASILLPRQSTLLDQLGVPSPSEREIIQPQQGAIVASGQATTVVASGSAKDELIRYLTKQNNALLASVRLLESRVQERDAVIARAKVAMKLRSEELAMAREEIETLNSLMYRRATNLRSALAR